MPFHIPHEHINPLLLDSTNETEVLEFTCRQNKKMRPLWIRLFYELPRLLKKGYSFQDAWSIIDGTWILVASYLILIWPTIILLVYLFGPHHRQI